MSYLGLWGTSVVTFPRYLPSFLFLMFLVLGGEMSFWDRKGASWRWLLLFRGSDVLNKISIATVTIICAHSAGWLHFMNYIKSVLWKRTTLWGSKKNPRLRCFGFFFCSVFQSGQTLLLGQEPTFHFMQVGTLLDTSDSQSHTVTYKQYFCLSAVVMLTGLLSCPTNSSVISNLSKCVSLSDSVVV